MKYLPLIATLTFVLILPLQKASAQASATDANITGDVICNGDHVPHIHVTLDGTTIGTSTDATGHFQLTNLPAGTFTLRVTGIGYKTATRKVITLADQTQVIRFEIEEDIMRMEEVVVSADRNQTNRSETPVVITSVSPALFERTQSSNLAEGLCFTPGLRTECNCQNCGFTQLRMNGLDGPYTQILVNSRPVFSGLAGVYGLELIPSNMVERIEVVRGGGSALFGGNAIAGTVNVITRESRMNSFQVESRYGVIGSGSEHGTAPAGDAQISLQGSVVTDDQKSGGFFYGMYRDKESYDENGDGFSDLVGMENTTFGFNTYHKPGARSKISLDGYRIHEFRRGGNMLEYLPHEADIAEQVEHRITGGNLSFDLFTNDKYDKLTLYAATQGVDRDSYYGGMQDPNAYGQTNDFTSSVGGQYVINADEFLFAASTTVFGIDNNTNLVHDRKLGAGGRPNTTLTHQLVNTLGTFIQHDWKGKRVNLSVGVRFDNYMIRDRTDQSGQSHGDYSNMVLAPRLNALYKFSPNLRFRLGYGKGYRAPQVFNEDFHVELINARRVRHFNAPGLIQETSHSFTASVNSDFNTRTSLHELLVEGFYTLLQNPFADEFFELDTLGSWGYRRVNAEEDAFVRGVNMEWNSFWGDRLSSQLGLTMQQSRYNSPQAWGEGEESVTTQFVRTPDTYGYATFEWATFEHFTTALTFNYTGSMWVPHFGLDPDTEDPAGRAALENGDVIAGERLERSEQFFITDLLFTYELHLTRETNLELFAGVKNIFNQLQKNHDRGMFRDAGYIYGPCQPRTINFGIRIGNSLR